MLNKIGFFQLDNLIKNRIPFYLLNMGPDISSWFISLYKEHLTKNQILVQPPELLPILESKKLALDAAIILLCSQGSTSLEMYQELQKKGYTNVYVVDGGYQQMMTERPIS